MESTKEGTRVFYKMPLALMAMVVLTPVFSDKTAEAEVLSLDMAANIVTPIALTQVDSLDFGDIAIDSATADDVRMGTNATGRSSVGAGGATLLASDPGTDGEFTIAGIASAAIDLTIPAGPFTVTDGTNTMAVSNFQLSLDTAADAALSTTVTSGAIDASGTSTASIGADLAVAANQTANAYTGTIDITVVYQ